MCSRRRDGSRSASTSSSTSSDTVVIRRLPYQRFHPRRNEVSPADYRGDLVCERVLTNKQILSTREASLQNSIYHSILWIPVGSPLLQCLFHHLRSDATLGHLLKGVRAIL